MNDYLTSITPDGISGALFALEGVAGSVVLLNGPTGCRYYHSGISERQILRQKQFDPLNFNERFFFGQSRIPSTFLDSGDYIYGGRDKLVEGLEYIKEKLPNHKLLAIVNTPGAALIGDDLEGIVNNVFSDIDAVLLETPGYSTDICAGFETGALALLETLNPQKKPVVDKTVNLLGLSLFQKYFKGDLAELKRLLGLCGIKVNCALCAGSSIEEIMDIGAAALNIVVRHEYGIRAAKYLEDTLGTAYMLCDGPPIGFGPTEDFVVDICARLGADPGPALEDCGRARAAAYMHVWRLASSVGLPRGARVAVEGTYSEIYAYFKFFIGYFGMLPQAACVFCPEMDGMRHKTEELLAAHGLSGLLGRDIMSDGESELVFASGATISRLVGAGFRFVGVENALPSMGYVDVIDKTHLGVAGSMLIVEQVLNGLLF
ncbi:MAG: oxidoreductase [Eubacteriaceae bacterium]|nr:oxidoreductase [Eubacteriaceae bacterium]